MLDCVVCKEKRNKLSYIILNTFAGANTGPSGGWSPHLGYVSLGSQTQTQKSKMEENKILPTSILYTSSSRSTLMILQCIKSCFICLCECTSSNSCYFVFAYWPFLF